MLRRPFLLLLLVLVVSGRAKAEPRPKVLLMVPSTSVRGGQLAAAEEVLTASDRYNLVLLQALVTPMQSADVEKKIRSKAAALEEEGRKAQLGLDYTLARAKFTAALELLESGYIRYYDPRALAQLRLLLGSLALNKARPDLARQEFVKALHLDPTLRPTAHYSPQVRTAFLEAATSLPPRPEPPPKDVQRIARLAGAKHAIVLGVQAVGDQTLLKGSLMQTDKGSYAKLESALVNPKKPDALRIKARSLGTQLRQRVEALLPKPLPPATQPFVKNGKKNGKHPPPPPKPWYLRWYTFVAAGAVVATAIILPLALSEEHVGVTVIIPEPKPANAP
jgi:hypothetical protein